MPTYEFRCPNGHDFEKFYKTISGAQLELPCPECGAMAARQLSGGAGLVFKGSGFYLTDYGKNAHRGDSKTTGAAAESAKADGGAKNDAGDKKGESREPKRSEGEGKAEGSKAQSGPQAGGTPKAESREAKVSKPKAKE